MRSAQRPSSPSLNTMPDSSRSFAFSSIDQSYARDAGIEELLETIEKLTERQKLCVKTYQFKEAADIKQRIKELKKEVIVKRCLYIENRHTEEIQQIIEAQQEELRNFDEFWTQKINEYSTEAQELEQQILDKHAEDMEIMREELQETMPVKPIKSPKHLEYKTMIKSLAKTEDFLEADKFMKKVAEIEKQEWVKAETEKDKKIRLQLGQLSSQQKVEIASIKQKINAGSDKLVKIRDEERAKLQQKFKNMMQEIKMAQQLEISRFELKYKSYIPDEKLAITARKREGGKSFSKCLAESVFASTTSLTGWDKTASTSDLKAEKKVLAQQKKSLIETLCTNSIAGKTDRAASFKHRRTNSMQTMKI